MKPVTLDDVNKLVEDKSILLVNKDLLCLDQFVQLLLWGTNNITSKKGGISLPAELWVMVIKYTMDSILAKRGEFCYVQAATLEKVMLSKVGAHNNEARDERAAFYLSCRYVDIVDVPKARHMHSATDIKNYEAFLASPDKCKFVKEKLQRNRGEISYCCDNDSSEIEGKPWWHREEKASPKPPSIHIVNGNGKVDFRALVGYSGSSIYTLQPLLEKACISHCITVPDIISRFEEGRCCYCKGRKFVCPGCSPGMGETYGIRVGCGVQITCPLCMGLDLSLKEKDFFGKNNLSEDEEDKGNAAIDKAFCERMVDLGYVKPRERQ